MKNTLVLLMMFALAAILCPPQTAFAATPELTDANNGGKLHLKAGEFFELHLASNPTTGFTWYVQADSTPLLSSISQTMLLSPQPDNGRPPAVGRPGVQIFRIQAGKRGKGTLLLHYVRSWDRPSPNERRFVLCLSIR